MDTDITVDAELAAFDKADALLRKVFGDGRDPLPVVRARLDDAMLDREISTAVDIEAATVGGVDSLTIAPSDSDPRHAVVWLHGGGYVMGSAKGYQGLAADIAVASGARVIVPDYRLAPEHVFPAALDDALAVLTEVMHTFGSGATVIAGDSAGGGLSFAALTELCRGGGVLPAGCVTVSPLADLTASGATYESNADADVVITKRGVGAIRATYAADLAPADSRISPALGDLSGLPPALILASDREALLDDAVMLKDAISAVGGRVELSVYMRVCHAWPMFPFIPATGRAIEEIGQFVRAVTVAV
ncbi:alpha/beta hydrolase [Streptomyces hirsutus]|uniref:alpha/beta hydrolase n=1 Tax=Streptomyces hirsutus TaxID=35620 RepID=UPI00343DAA8A